MNAALLAVALAAGSLTGLPGGSDATCMLGEGVPQFGGVFDPAVPVPLVETEHASANAPAPADPASLQACLVSYAEVRADAQLVDMRPHRDAGEIWVERALHEPSQARIAQAPIFRDTPLALFGTGHDDVRLARACVELRSAGLEHVVVVRKGMRAIAAAGEAVHGNLHALDGLGRLDARSLHDVLASGPVTILDAAGLNSEARDAFGPSVQWVVTTTSQRLDAKAWQAIDIVLLPDKADTDEWIESQIPAGVVAPLTYSHGVEALASYVAESTFRAAERVRTAPLRCAG